MAKHRHCPRRGVYAITPDGMDTDLLIQRTEIVLAAGIALLQYRNKTADRALRQRQARALRGLSARHRVPLIINDDVGLAREVEADGVHLGEHDPDPAEARRALGPDAIIGTSCYDDLDRAKRAAGAGASYLAFGAFHPTRTKSGTRCAQPAILGAAHALGLPVVAIGGIKPDNAAPLISAGADLIAVVSGVFQAPDPAAAIRAYLACFDSANPQEEPT